MSSVKYNGSALGSDYMLYLRPGMEIYNHLEGLFDRFALVLFQCVLEHWSPNCSPLSLSFKKEAVKTDNKLVKVFSINAIIKYFSTNQDGLRIKPR